MNPISLALLLLASVQMPMSDSPRAQLHPRTIAEIELGGASDLNRVSQQLQQIQATDVRNTAQLSSIEKQHEYLLGNQDKMIQQVQVLTDIRLANVERIAALDRRMTNVETRIQRAEDSPYNRDVAVLETKVDTILRTGTWLMAGVGSLMIAAISAAIRPSIGKLLRKKRT